MIACIPVRWQISRRLDDRRPFPPAVRRHLDRCAGCRAFADRSSGTAERLRVDAGPDAGRIPADDRRAEAILVSVRQIRASQAMPASEPPMRPWRWAAATAFALALAATAIFTHRLWGPRIASPLDHLQPVVTAVAEGGARLNDSLDRMVAVSYETEKARLGADAEAAASFLLACLSL